MQEEHFIAETSKVFTEIEEMKNGIRKNKATMAKGIEEIERIKLILIENQKSNII